MKLLDKDFFYKNKKLFGILFVVLIIFLGWLFLKSEKPEKVIKKPTKLITYDMSSISLSIKKDGYLFTSKDNGYKKLKLAMEEVLNNITGPALESNTIPDDSNKKSKDITTVNKLKNETVNVGSIIYINSELKTKIKLSSELGNQGKSDEKGNLVIPAHEFLIILSGEYQGLLLTKSEQDAERWSAWEVSKESIQHLTELIRQGVK